MENNLHETCVNFEVAKLLKEVGFNWDCKYVYDLLFPTSCKNNEVCDNYSSTKNQNRFSDLISAPTLEVAQKWLRDVHGIIFTIEAFVVNRNDAYNERTMYTCRFLDDDITLHEYETYEDAQAAGIQAALEMCF